MAPRPDLLHTNTIEILDGRLAAQCPAFRAGNLLISVLELDTVAVLDPDRGEIVWALTGPWRKQHQPTVVGRGSLLVFDNLGAGPDRSRVLEIDPFTQEVLWRYGGDRATDFFSKTLGTAQRLPNGNTLITESENGRAFEVTPDGSVVWELVSPHRAGEHDELVAVLFEVVRLPPDFPFPGRR
jgi:outer membrane protein assembly factor BamB